MGKLPPAHDFWEQSPTDKCLSCGLDEPSHDLMERAPDTDFKYDGSFMEGGKLYYVRASVHANTGMWVWVICGRDGEELNPKYPFSDYDRDAFIDRAHLFG